MAHPALYHAQLVSICGLVLGTGRVRGDVGQHTCLGHDAGVEGSRPDHILMSDKVHITEDHAISDHCPISMTFQVPETSLEGADWRMQAEHVCKPGGCGSRISMKWRPELAEVYMEALVGNSEMQNQFEQAIAKEDPMSACEKA
eukprot:1140170-Pelagomonas_calceolata.AAC.1